MSRTPGSLTLVSVTTKHKSLHWARKRHLSMVEPFTITGLAEKQHLVISFIDVRVYSLVTVEWNEFLPGSSSSHPGLRSRKQRPFIYFWCLNYGNYGSHETPAVRSFIYVDVGEPTSHPCSMTVGDHRLDWMAVLSGTISDVSRRKVKPPQHFFFQQL